MPRKKIDALVDMAKGYGAKGLAYLCIGEDGSYKSSFAKFMTEEELTALVKAMDGENGDLLLFAADKNAIVWSVLGASASGTREADGADRREPVPIPLGNGISFIGME